MTGRTIKQFLVLGCRTKRGVALNEEIALNEVVRHFFYFKLLKVLKNFFNQEMIIKFVNNVLNRIITMIRVSTHLFNDVF